MAHVVVNELVEKKGENIILLDVHEVTSFTDYFILCTGTSNRMLHALAQAVMEKTKGEYMTTNRLEGKPESGWIVIDYGSIVVHLMDEELRSFYNIEELWKDGRIVVRMQ